MERVLVPIDFSEDSITALQRAIYFANQVGMHVRMVHVKKEKVLSYLLEPNTNTKWPDDLLKEYLTIIQTKYAPQYTAGGTFDYVIRSGSINTELQAQGVEDNAYAYFLGLQGVSTLKDFLIGGNAYRLLSTSKIPVFTSRTNIPIGNFQNILLPIEYKTDSRIKIPWVGELAKSFNAKVHIWGYSPDPESELNPFIAAYVKQAEEYMDKLGVDFASTFIKDTKYIEPLMEYVETNNIDLISVMSDVNDDIIERLLGSHAIKVLNESPVPVICIPALLTNKTKKENR